MVVVLPVISSLYSIINRGGICVLPNWVDSPLVTALRNDIHQLRDHGLFIPSGLSNREPGDTNAFDPIYDRQCVTITPTLPVHGKEKETIDHVRTEIDQRLETLGLVLSATLNRPNLTLQEQYYSISGTGASLPLHMDERHEETKGEKGWTTDTRRSISYLLYLNSNKVGNEERSSSSTNWIHGGELRAYCRLSEDGTVNCGAHHGDLQIGWLSRHTRTNTGTKTRTMFDPIFLNCWRQDKGGMDRSVPRSAMYRIRGRSSGLNGLDVFIEQEENEDVEDGVEWISKDFDATDLMAAVCKSRSEARQNNLGNDDDEDDDDDDDDEGMTPSEFALALAAQISINNNNNNKVVNSMYRDHIHSDDAAVEDDVFFVAVEDVTTGKENGSLQVVDIPPLAGTLILFDSVVVPHEVLPVAAGSERLAIGGWFHEPMQSFPSWYMEEQL